MMKRDSSNACSFFLCGFNYTLELFSCLLRGETVVNFLAWQLFQKFIGLLTGKLQF